MENWCISAVTLTSVVGMHSWGIAAELMRMGTLYPSRTHSTTCKGNRFGVVAPSDGGVRLQPSSAKPPTLPRTTDSALRERPEEHKHMSAGLLFPRWKDHLRPACVSMLLQIKIVREGLYAYSCWLVVVLCWSWLMYSGFRCIFAG